MFTALTRGPIPGDIFRSGKIAGSARSLMAMVAATLFCGAAHAGTLAGGPIYGGSSQTSLVCYVINTGSSTVTNIDVVIKGESGDNVRLIGDSCGSSLAPQSSCVFDGSVTTDEAHSCEVTISGSAASLRGEFEVRSSTGSLLNSIGLR